MSQPRFLTGLDIGSNSIRIAVGQMANRGETDALQIIAAVEVLSNGVSKGTITSIEDATASISSCIERIERMIGAQLQSAWVGISGGHIISNDSSGVVAIAKPDGEIRDEDVDRALDAARTVATPLNYEILHVVPRSFTVDGQANIRDPLGMNGIRLEVDAQIIQGLSAQIKNLTKCVYRTGLDIEDLVLSILATSEAVVTKKQKDLGVMVMNLGAAATSFAVFEEGDLLYAGVVPIGGGHITADLAIGLRTSVDVAERVKLECGTAASKSDEKKEAINLVDFGGEDEIVSLKYITEIIAARVEQLYERVDKDLKKIGRSGMLPAGVILTGGGAQLRGLVELAKEKLRLPASLGYPIGFMSAVDKINDLSFSGAVGLVRWGAESQKSGKENSGRIKIPQLGNMLAGLIRWIKSLMP